MYFLKSCEYKWTHAKTDMEKLWIMRELGTDIFKIVEQNNWEWHWLRSNSQTLPGDIYCRCDIYVDIPDTKQATHFLLKYPKAILVEKV
jgi:hypothetical protein